MGIEFRRVNYSYDNKRNALLDVDLSIKSEGEFICVAGRTGSGKSTLLQHMNALILPTSGELIIMDRKINLNKKKNKNINDIRRNVGLVFQFPEYQLFEETVLKDVMFGPKNFGMKHDECERIAKESLLACGISEDLFEKSPFALSGGQQKRVTIASVLAMDPKIIILDEPTRGLDPKGRNEILTLFKELHERTNKTVIIITHDMDTVASYAKRVVVMKDSKKVFDGTPHDLFKQDLAKLDLDQPNALKIANRLKERLGLDLGYIISEEELTKKLMEVGV